MVAMVIPSGTVVVVCASAIPPIIPSPSPIIITVSPSPSVIFIAAVLISPSSVVVFVAVVIVFSFSVPLRRSAVSVSVGVAWFTVSTTPNTVPISFLIIAMSVG